MHVLEADYLVFEGLEDLVKTRFFSADKQGLYHIEHIEPRMSFFLVSGSYIGSVSSRCSGMSPRSPRKS